MSDRQKISRKKGNASNISNPSLAPKVPSLATSTHDSASESHQTITKQSETSQEVEKTVEEQENQENISLKESPLGNFNILERASIFRPQETIQRQELVEEEQKHSEVVQRKLNAEELEDKQEELSPLSKAFQIQKSEDNKLDSPIESFNYLEKISITRPKQTLQRQDTNSLPEIPNYQLTTPSLLQPPETSSRYSLGVDSQLELDSEIQAMAALIQQQMELATVRAALSQVNLLPSLPGLESTAPNPFSLPPTPQSPPLVPPGEGPDTPRSATRGNLMSAILALPTVDSAIASLQTQALAQLSGNWRQLSTPEQVGVVSSVVVIAGSALAGVLSNPTSREFALSQLNGRVLPVPSLNWLHLELNTESDNLMMGLHVDVGSLLPSSLGFGSSSTEPIGAPPSPEPFVPSQSVQRKEVVEPKDKQELSPLSRAFQPQKNQSSSSSQLPDSPIESFNYLENISINRPQSTVQRQEVGEREEEEQENESIQTKLTIGEPGDKYEEEADTTAAKVMAMSDEAVQRNLTPNTSSITETEEELQTKAEDNNTQAVSNLENRLGSSKGEGSPLSDDVRAFMEPRFGADFSGVRVHNDSSAVQMNKELSAQAFAHGNDIYYGAGKSPGNNELTAHELTHTIQQTGGKTQAKFINKKENKENKVQLKNPRDTESAEINSVILEREGSNQISPDSVENPQKEQQAGNAVTGEKPQNGQKNSKVSQETADDNAEKSPKQETNATNSNSGENLQKNQEATPQQSGNQGVNQENNATVLETTSQETAPVSPESDPDFQAVVAKAKGVASKEKQHAPAGTKAKQAQNAAQSPTSELESKAQGNQVGEMEQAPTPAFNAAAFKAKLMERIKEAAPKNLDEANKFKDNNKLGSVKNEMQEKVKQEQTASQTPLEEKAKQAPDTSGIEPKSVTPLPANEAGAATQNIGAQKAVPKPKGQNEIEAPLQQSSQQLNQQMADANVTEEQLAFSNEPEFQNALAAKQEADTNANQAPQQYRQFEQNQLTQAKGEASATAQQKLQGMHGDRAQLLSQVTNQQLVTKDKDEQERAKIAGDIQNIYQQTKTKVENTLNGLDSQVEKAFDSGAAEAQKDFEDEVDRKMEAYKDERYSGAEGALLWTRDLFLDLPSEVNIFYQEGRKNYIKKMDVVLNKIVNIIGIALTNAKAEIAKGRKRIQQYVTKLPQNLQTVGQQAATDIQNQFDELEQSVDSKQDELINNLAQKYNEKLQAVDSRIEELKAANQGLFSQATNAMTGAINTINKLKEMLLSVLGKAAGVIGNIIQDPIGFLGNLISGIKQGFENFVGNIWEHLQSGLIGWLTGALGPMGIQMPDDVFSLPGIFSLTTQVLGLTFNFIRGKAVKRFGEPVVAGMEQSVEVFQVLRDRGAMGLWEQVQEQFNDLKETVIEQIKDMVITQVITAGVKWIIGLLNPASAFVKAAMAIYDIIMFFVNRGSQVLELVNSIVDAVVKIASGAVGGAAKLIENALSRALPVVIGFLASVAGIGGLAKKVEGIIGRVRSRIDKAIDKVLLKAKGLFKGKKGKKGKGDKDEDGKFTQKDKDAGLAAFEKQEKAFVKDGAITQADARKVGKIVKDKHPVFKSITVVDGKDSWDYKYVFRSDSVDTKTSKAESNSINRKDIIIEIKKRPKTKEGMWTFNFHTKQMYLGMVLTEGNKYLVEVKDSGKNLMVQPENKTLENILKEEAKEAYKKVQGEPSETEQREINRNDIFSKTKKINDTKFEVELYAIVDKQRIWWGSGQINLDKYGSGEDAADHLLEAVDKEIYAEKVSRLRIKEGDSFTKVAIEETNKAYKKIKNDHNTEIPILEALLDEYNRFIFQLFFANSNSRDTAIEATPFAKGRKKLGYKKFEFEKVGDFQDIDLSEEIKRFPYADKEKVDLANQLRVKSVPKKIEVKAMKSL